MARNQTRNSLNYRIHSFFNHLEWNDVIKLIKLIRHCTLIIITLLLFVFVLFILPFFLC